jgi:hypothetical protein
MPMTVLNKTIAIFLIGASFLLVVWLKFSFSSAVPDLAKDALAAYASLGPVTQSLVFFVAAIFLGIHIDAFANLVVRPIVARCVAQRCKLARFLAGADCERYSLWRDIFKHSIKDARVDDLLKQFNGDKHYFDCYGAVAAGIFMQHAGKDQFELLTTHYSASAIGSCLAPIWLSLILDVALVENLPFTTKMASIGVLLIVLVLIVANIFAEYAYANSIVLRFASLHMNEIEKKSDTGG